MLKLMKYDLKSCHKPFLWIIALNVGLLLISSLGIFSKDVYESFLSLYNLVDYGLLIYGGREFYKEFCTDRNILDIIIPVDIVKKFFSKFFLLTLCYTALQLSRLLFNLISPYSIYNTLKKVIVNYKPYIIYDFTGGILFYTSTLAIIAFGLLLANSMTRRKAVVPVLNVLIIFALFCVSLNIYQNRIEDPSRQGIDFRIKKGVTEVRLDYRVNYVTFAYNQVKQSMFLEDSTDKPRFIEGYSWLGIEYGSIWMAASLILGVGLVKWKGINY